MDASEGYRDEIPSDVDLTIAVFYLTRRTVKTSCMTNGEDELHDEREDELHDERCATARVGRDGLQYDRRGVMRRHTTLPIAIRHRDAPSVTDDVMMTLVRRRFVASATAMRDVTDVDLYIYIYI